MSDEKLPVGLPISDLTEEDLKRVELFVQAGAPGFNLADVEKITKMMDLYLSGKTYHQIARITGSQKDLVMLYSQKLEWYPIKIEYLKELEGQMKFRVLHAKMQSQDFLLQLTQMWQKKIGKKIDTYLQTGDESHSDNISLKEIDKYLKTVETLNKLASDPNRKGDSPSIGLNVGDGVTIKKTGDNSVEITPKTKSIGSMLEGLANKRRETELAAKEAKPEKTSDIKEVNPNKGENGNDNT